MTDQPGPQGPSRDRPPLWKRRRYWLFTGGGMLGVFIFLIVLGLIVGPQPSKTAAPTATTTPAPTTTTTTVPSTTTTQPPPVTTTTVAAPAPPAAVATTIATIPAYVPPPPDAAGNPPCPLPNTWDTSASGAGISATVYRDGPAAVMVTVRKESGTESQSATIKPGQSLHQFDFPSVDKSGVLEVLAISDGSRCYITGFAP